eukprot:gene6485-7227_t
MEGKKKKLSSSQFAMRYNAAREANEGYESENEDDLTYEPSQIPLDFQVEAVIPPTKSLTTPISHKKSTWRWNDEMVDNLVPKIYEYKIKKDFEGKDMESDLVKMYEDVTKMMAILYRLDHFGRVESSNIDVELSAEERIKCLNDIQAEKKAIKIGYGRVKEKIKQLCCNFKRVIVDGTRSGGGKMICQNWDHVVKIWGDCPSVTRILEANTSQVVNNKKNEDQLEGNILSEDNETDQVEEQESEEPKQRKHPLIEQSRGAKLIDDKHAKLEKILSAPQRDLLMANVAKEELALRKKHAEVMQKSPDGLEKAVETMAKSLASFGDQIGSGLMLLAQSLGTNQSAQHTYHHPGFQPTFQCTTRTSALYSAALHKCNKFILHKHAEYTSQR